MMIAEIKNVGKYGDRCKQFGVVDQVMMETTVINFTGYNTGGHCINISKGDYRLCDSNDFAVVDDKIYLKTDRDLKFIDLGYKPK